MSFEADYKMISDLMPRYDGNPKRLNYYIREVDNLLSFTHTAQGAAAQALVCLIKSRLSGAAIDAIAYEDSLNSWSDIKQTLLQRLGEPRNEIQVMQELTRTRRNKNEDAESYGKRIRDMLDTLYMIGKHSDKTYYEKMAIEQYVSQLEFHVSIGVRIAKPDTLELAIINARQEEAKSAFRNNSFNNNTQISQHNKPKPDFKHNNVFTRQVNTQPLNNPFNFASPQRFIPQNNYVPQPNNLTPEQRQQLVNSILPWKNRQTQPQGMFRNNSGTFRNNNYFGQPNIPKQQVNPPQVSSDVTMRSVNKPGPPQFAFQELFYTPYECNSAPSPSQYDAMMYQPMQETPGMYYQPQGYQPFNYQPPIVEEEQADTTQDFPEDQDTDDQS